MTKIKNKKQKKIEGLQNVDSRMENSQAMLVMKNNKIKPREMWDLKGKIRATEGSECFIEKNKIVKIGAQRKGIYENISHLLNGPNIFVFVEDEEGLAKVTKDIFEFSDENPVVEILGGCLFAGDKKQYLSLLDLERISELPTKDEMRAMLIGTLRAPQSKTVSLFTAAQRDVVCLIKNYIEKINS